MSYNRQQLVINDFGGVDLSSSPLQVHSSRASFATNLIKDNGVNHKRPGWRQELNFAGKQINGIYEYKNDGHEVLIVYAGKTFYEVKDGTAAQIDFQADENFPLQDQKVQFFRQRGRVYIIGCGDYLVYGSWDEGETYELRRVYGDEDTYVPTVVTDLRSRGSGTFLEGVNLLTLRRKAILIGSGKNGKWYLPECMDYYKPVTFTITYTKYTPADESQSIVTEKFEVYPPQHGYDGNEIILDWADLTSYTEEGEVPYYECTGGISIGFDTTPPGDTAYGNIIVEYSVPERHHQKYLKYIPKCSIGTTFGAYGRSDRLFLSGNSEMKNVDFYSGFEDFTYFSANSRTEMGSDDAAITGYLRLSDSTLATFKEGFGNEPTVYYRKATEVDDNGADAIAFTRFEGSVGEACINPYCVANLAGDELMLSENGLFGIVIPENLNNNDRYFRERSRHINADLRRRELKNATSIVYKNRYYLAVDGVCYVADPRFKTYLSDDIDGSFNYEWWYWDNIPARVFAILGDKLCFGTDDGKICVFDDKFTDRTYDNTVNGQLTADGDKLIHESAMDVNVCDGDEIELSGYSGRLYVTGYKASESTFKVSKVKGGAPIANIRTELGIGTSVTALTMKVWCYKNVVSRWFTPVFDFGAFDFSKTLLSMTVTLDPSIRGKLRFGYEIKHAESLTEGGAASDGSADLESGFVFDFYGMASGLLSFDSGFTSSYTVKVKARHFNYIMFKFISDTDTDCAVHNFKATYVINGRNRGTR